MCRCHMSPLREAGGARVSAAIGTSSGSSAALLRPGANSAMKSAKAWALIAVRGYKDHVCFRTFVVGCVVNMQMLEISIEGAGAAKVCSAAFRASRCG